MVVLEANDVDLVVVVNDEVVNDDDTFWTGIATKASVGVVEQDNTNQQSAVVIKNFMVFRGL
jgi:hypothetical protein